PRVCAAPTLGGSRGHAAPIRRTSGEGSPPARRVRLRGAGRDRRRNAERAGTDPPRAARVGLSWIQSASRVPEDVIEVFFVCFHFMPWPHLPADFEQHHETAWLTLPNSFYDPARGHALYGEYLDQLALAETLGFDAVGVNEHHQSAYGLMPS